MTQKHTVLLPNKIAIVEVLEASLGTVGHVTLIHNSMGYKVSRLAHTCPCLTSWG